MTRSSVLPFVCSGVTFHCWVVDDRRYEWIDDSGRLRAGRTCGGATYWSQRDAKPLGSDFRTLKLAMSAAVRPGYRMAA